MSRLVTTLFAVLALFAFTSTAVAEEGVVEEDVQVITESEMPDAVPREFEESKYSTWKIEKTAKVNTMEWGTVYEYEVTDGETFAEIYFNPAGEIVSKDVGSGE